MQLFEQSIRYPSSQFPWSCPRDPHMTLYRTQTPVRHAKLCHNQPRHVLPHLLLPTEETHATTSASSNSINQTPLPLPCSLIPHNPISHPTLPITNPPIPDPNNHNPNLLILNVTLSPTIPRQNPRTHPLLPLKSIISQMRPLAPLLLIGPSFQNSRLPIDGSRNR